MKVAKIIDQYTVAITKDDEVFLGIGDILTVAAEPIIDPETGASLGNLATLRVKVREVYDQFVVAETYRSGPTKMEVEVNIGDDVQPFVPGES